MEGVFKRHVDTVLRDSRMGLVVDLVAGWTVAFDDLKGLIQSKQSHDSNRQFERS